MKFSDLRDNLIKHLQNIPGLGPKNSTRVANYLLANPILLKKLGMSMIQAYRQARFCKYCRRGSITDICAYCQDGSRTPMLCVVATEADMLAIERARSYKGYYLITHECTGPSSAINALILHFKLLIQKIKPQKCILAWPTNPEGIYNQQLFITAEPRCSYYALKAGIAYDTPLDQLSRASLIYSLNNLIPLCS